MRSLTYKERSAQMVRFCGTPFRECVFPSFCLLFL